MKCTVCGKESEHGAKVIMTIFGEKTFFYCSPHCVKKSGHGKQTKETLLKMFEDRAIIQQQVRPDSRNNLQYDIDRLAEGLIVAARGST
jgi:hypothetical protein